MFYTIALTLAETGLVLCLIGQIMLLISIVLDIIPDIVKSAKEIGIFQWARNYGEDNGNTR